MNKGLKILIGVIVTALTLYNSVYFMPLDDKLASSNTEEFDAVAFVNGIWEKDLLNSFSTATEISELYQQLQTSPEKTFNEKAQALGIGNIAYFKVQGSGKVIDINENNVILQVADIPVELETEFIFGNAIRDASGLIKINDYTETSDFNSISEAINDRVRKTIIPDFINNVASGDQVKFSGAIELNKKHLNLNQPEIIPLSIQIIK